jgi:hypothetical protein
VLPRSSPAPLAAIAGASASLLLNASAAARVRALERGDRRALPRTDGRLSFAASTKIALRLRCGQQRAHRRMDEEANGVTNRGNANQRQ